MRERNAERITRKGRDEADLYLDNVRSRLSRTGWWSGDGGRMDGEDGRGGVWGVWEVTPFFSSPDGNIGKELLTSDVANEALANDALMWCGNHEVTFPTYISPVLVRCGQDSRGLLSAASPYRRKHFVTDVANSLFGVFKTGLITRTNLSILAVTSLELIQYASHFALQ